jgi:hypothetical protein
VFGCITWDKASHNLFSANCDASERVRADSSQMHRSFCGRAAEQSGAADPGKIIRTDVRFPAKIGARSRGARCGWSSEKSEHQRSGHPPQILCEQQTFLNIEDGCSTPEKLT